MLSSGGPDPCAQTTTRPEPLARCLAPEAPSLSGQILRFPAENRPEHHPGYGMPVDIAKLTEDAEIAQASYEALVNVYELSSGVEKIRLVSRLTSALMRRDETLFALGAALRAPQKDRVRPR